MIALIPFGGFYQSDWADMLDRAEDEFVDYLIGENDSGEGVAPFIGADRADVAQAVYLAANYRAAFADLAEAYAQEFAHRSGIRCKFAELSSPREYNFETDKIMVTIPRAEVRRLRREVDTKSMDAIAKDRHTSCSGFLSFYSPEWRTWGAVDTWEPQQLLTLILASVDGEIEEECFENMQGNGAADNALACAVTAESAAVEFNKMMSEKRT